MPLKPSLRAICHYRALSAFTVYNRGGGGNSSVLGGFFWPSVGLLARTAGKSLKPLVNEGDSVRCRAVGLRSELRHEIAPGLSLALIGNASGRKPSVNPGRRSEAFSIRRLGASRWCLRQMRRYGD